MRLDGRLEDYSVLHVLEAALRQSGSCQLLIADDEREGLLQLEDGHIVGAHLGEVTGEDALFDILAWQRGLFSLSGVGHSWPASGDLHWTWSKLLHEAFRRAAKAGAQEIAPLSEGEVEVLERDLELLFQNLGGDIARLADEGSGPVALLEALCEMLNMAASLSPEQAKRLDFELADVLPRHGWKGSGQSFVQLEGSLVNGRSVREVYAAAAFDPESRRLEARATARMLGSTLDEILERLCNLLPRASQSRQAQERSRNLTHDLKSLIRNCSF